MQIPRTAWILIVIAALVAVVVALFNWNWLRGPISSYMSTKFGRPFVINGDLHGEFSLKPRLTADYVTLANTPWSTDPMMARAQHVSVRVDVLSLFGPTVSLPELSLVRPVLLLERDAEGRENWDFGGVPEIPRIGRLTIDSGVVRFLDPTSGTDVTVNVASALEESGEMPVKFKGSGRLRKNEFTIEGTSASLLALENTDQPYRLDVQAKAGSTGAKFNGSIVPARIDNVDGALALQGRDLSQLYPIIPVPFPWTPPYRLSGNLKHGSGVWSFREFSGKVGDSDLAGRFDVDRKSQRTIVDADLVSQHLNYKDLGGLVGLPPPSAPAEKSTTAQNKEAAKREVSGRSLPTKPYEVEGLRAVDAKVHLKGKRFIASDLPLDNLDAVLDLKDGVLKLQPLDFGVAGGHLASTLTMDARNKIIKTTGDVTVRNVELKQIVPALKPPKGSAGKVGGRAHFTATGNSVADMLATSGPIVIDGSFKNPNVHPAVGPIVARVGTSLALGALNPLAALLALNDFGGASDANCRALIAEASGNVQATATAQKTATK